MVKETPTKHPSLLKWLAVSLVITAAARAVPSWWVLAGVWRDWLGGAQTMPYDMFYDLVLLFMGLCLVLSTPRQSGLRIGKIREHWKGTLLVCGVPALLVALVYPNLPERPFSGASWSMWAISPLAQDLVFQGFLYGQLARCLPKAARPWLPGGALLVGGAFFALWHVPNLAGGMSAGYLVFQLGYTFVGYVIVGLTRQWTGSFLYATLAHSVVNYVAWASG